MIGKHSFHRMHIWFKWVVNPVLYTQCIAWVVEKLKHLLRQCATAAPLPTVIFILIQNSSYTCKITTWHNHIPFVLSIYYVYINNLLADNYVVSIIFGLPENWSWINKCFCSKPNRENWKQMKAHMHSCFNEPM